MLYFSEPMKIAENQPGELITMLRQHSRGIAVFFLIIFGSLIVDSCSYYRKKVLYRDQVSIDDINKNLSKRKQFVLVTTAQTWEVSGLRIVDNESLTMRLSSIKSSQIEDKLEYLKYNSRTRVKTGDELLQKLVVMHLLEDDTLQAGNIKLAISDIGKIEVYDADVGKSILIFAGFTLGFLAIVYIIILLTKSSCPFLYVYDGEEYQLAAETFGGAI